MKELIGVLRNISVVMPAREDVDLIFPLAQLEKTTDLTNEELHTARLPAACTRAQLIRATQ